MSRHWRWAACGCSFIAKLWNHLGRGKKTLNNVSTGWAYWSTSGGAAGQSGRVREVLPSDDRRYGMGKRKLRTKCRKQERLLPLPAAPQNYWFPRRDALLFTPGYFHPCPTPDLKMESEAPGPCRLLPPSAAAWGGIQGAASSPALRLAEHTQT